MELCQYPSLNKTRYFQIEAIQLPIVYNKYGDYDPDGLMYVLREDAQRIQKEALRRFQQMPETVRMPQISTDFLEPSL